MRRSRGGLESGADGELAEAHVSAALDEMLFSGGTLNQKLLGAAAVG